MKLLVRELTNRQKRSTNSKGSQTVCKDYEEEYQSLKEEQSSVQFLTITIFLLYDSLPSFIQVFGKTFSVAQDKSKC